jgi:hypothetical protein
MEHARHLGHHEKTKPMNRGCRRGKAIQTKGIDNLFNRLITENLPNFEKDRIIQVQEAYRTPNCQDPKRNIPDIQ